MFTPRACESRWRNLQRAHNPFARLELCDVEHGVQYHVKDRGHECESNTQN
jgi:hypothetical protein